MKSTSKKFAASTATLFTFAFLVATAPTARADDYCITNGAQAAHGCGYQTMEACQAASAGVGGYCSLSSSSKTSSDSKTASDSKSPGDSLAYQPKQAHSRSTVHSRKESAGH
jgi:Protein of unknown function (DUF3551)